MPTAGDTERVGTSWERLLPPEAAGQGCMGLTGMHGIHGMLSWHDSELSVGRRGA